MCSGFSIRFYLSCRISRKVLYTLLYCAGGIVLLDIHYPFSQKLSHDFPGIYLGIFLRIALPAAVASGCTEDLHIPTPSSWEATVGILFYHVFVGKQFLEKIPPVMTHSFLIGTPLLQITALTMCETQLVPHNYKGKLMILLIFGFFAWYHPI